MGIFWLTIAGTNRMEAKWQEWNWSPGLELGSQGLRTLSAFIGLCSSWAAASFSSPCLVSLHSRPPSLFLLVSFCHPADMGSSVWLEKMVSRCSVHLLTLGFCGAVRGSTSSPSIPELNFREGPWPCLARIPSPWIVPLVRGLCMTKAPAEPWGWNMR